SPSRSSSRGPTRGCRAAARPSTTRSPRRFPGTASATTWPGTSRRRRWRRGTPDLGTWNPPPSVDRGLHRHRAGTDGGRSPRDDAQYRRPVHRTTHRYGTRRGQVAELLVPDDAPSVCPVVVVVHGGFWRAQYTRHLTRGLARAIAGRGWATW